MQRLRSILGMLVLAGTLGWTSLALALPTEIKLSKAASMEIIRNGKPAGKLALAAGTLLEVTAIDGDWVQVKYRSVSGRVLAIATDLDARVAAAESAEAEEPAKENTPPPKAAEPAKVSAPPPKAVETQRVSASPPAVRLSVAPQQTSGTKPVGLSHATTEEPMSKSERVLLLGMLAGFFVTVAAQWRLFTKARKPGWACLIPIYNLIVWQQISGKPLWWIVFYFIPVANLVVAVLTTFGVANNFGKGTGFGFGLLLLPFIFVPVLAFSDAAYVGN